MFQPALLALATCTASETEAAQLRHLASKEGKEEYSSWVLQPYRSLLEVILMIINMLILMIILYI
jgi:hypothetical protein